MRLGQVQVQPDRWQCGERIQTYRPGNVGLQIEASVRFKGGKHRIERGAERTQQFAQFQFADGEMRIDGRGVAPRQERPRSEEFVPYHLGGQFRRNVGEQDTRFGDGQFVQLDAGNIERTLPNGILGLKELQDLPVGRRVIVAAREDQRTVQEKVMDQQPFPLQEGIRVRTCVQMSGGEQGIHLRSPSFVPFLRKRLETIVGIGNQQVLDGDGHVREPLHERKTHIAHTHIPLHLGRKDLDDRILERGGVEKDLERHQDQQGQSQQHSKDPKQDLQWQVAAFRHSADYNPIVLKKSLPLSSTRMKAGKSTTSIFQMASMPSSGYSTHSMLLIFSWARMAAGPPMEPR